MSSALAVGGSLGHIGQGLEQVSSTLSEFAMRKQNAVNAAAVVDAQTRMEKAQSAYQQDMTTNQDENTWVPNWQKATADLKSTVLSNPQLAPVVRDHLENQFKEFEQRSTSQISTQANVRTIQRQSAIFTNAANDAWEAGDFEKGSQNILKMVQLGLISDTKGQEMLAKGQNQVDVSNAVHGIATDPILALHGLEEKDKKGDWANYSELDENQRESLRVKAMQQISKVRQQTVDDLVDQQNNGKILQKADLQQLVDTQKLTSTQMRWILQSQGQPEDPKLNQHFAELLTDIDGYDHSKDKTNSQFAELAARRLALPKELQAEAKKRLDEKLNVTGAHVQTAEVNRYIDEMLGQGILGPIKGNKTVVTPGRFFGTNSEEVPVTNEEKQATYGRQVQLKQELKDFVRNNPNADAVQQRNFINSRVASFVDSKAATPLFNTISGRATQTQPAAQTPRITTKAQRDALPAGASYLGPDGKMYTKGQ